MSDYSKLKFADGSTAIVQIIALHRRRPHSLGVFDRPTDWLAQAGKHAAWGRTRREAFERLREFETLGDTKKGNPMHQSEPRRMLSEKQVLQLVPVSRSTLLRMEKAGKFPRSTYISPNRRIWFEDDIVAWQNAVDEFNPNRGRGKGRRPRGSPNPSQHR